jgi:hypothetical protein
VVVEKADNGAIKLQVECRRSDAFTNNYNPSLLSTWRANMDIKLVGNAYGAAEYTAAYVSKSEPDTTKFRDLISKAISKCSVASEHHDVLRRVANATLAAREVSAQEAMWIVQNGLPMYGKSRNVLKVKTTRHANRRYRVDPDTCRRAIQSETAEDEAELPYRIDPLEAAYMARPEHLQDMSYKSFLQQFDCSAAGPTPGQRLERWSRTDGRGFIKARRSQQAIAPSPRWKVDPDDPNYCFSEVMLRVPWRAVHELPESDAECIDAFHVLSQSEKNRTGLDDALERERNLTLLSESREPSSIRLPTPEWTLCNDDDSTDMLARH